MLVDAICISSRNRPTPLHDHGRTAYPLFAQEQLDEFARFLVVHESHNHALKLCFVDDRKPFAMRNEAVEDLQHKLVAVWAGTCTA